MLTFGFALPILAAAGITWVWERTEPRRWLTVGTTIVLVGLMAWPTVVAQNEQTPFMSPEDIRAGTEAGRIAATLPPGTPLVFAVDDLDTSASFLATHVANIARATVPPDRAQDVYVFVGTIEDYVAGRPTVKGSPEYDELSRRSLAELPEGPRALFVVPEYDRVPAAFDDPQSGALDRPRVVRPAEPASAGAAARRELVDSNPLAIAGSLVAGAGAAVARGHGMGVVGHRGPGRCGRGGSRVRRGDPDDHRARPGTARRAPHRIVGSDAGLTAWPASAGMGSASSSVRCPPIRRRRSMSDQITSTSITGVTTQ